MTTDYPIELSQGHLLLMADGRRWVLDTGSPTSIGVGELELAGRDFPLAGDFLGLTPGRLSEWLGMPVDGLIGTDILNAFDLILDVPGGHLTVGEALAWEAGIDLPASWVMGVPVVRCRVAPERCIRSFWTPVRSFRIFDPNCCPMPPMRQNTNGISIPAWAASRRRCSGARWPWGRKKQSLRFGRLPYLLETLLGMTGADGILGCELLRGVMGMSDVCKLSLKGLKEASGSYLRKLQKSLERVKSYFEHEPVYYAA